MSWATNLWDQLDNVERHTQWGMEFVERCCKFIRERSEIEIHYAKQLRQLNKKYQGKGKSVNELQFSVVCAFHAGLQSLTTMAEKHEALSDELVGNVVATLSQHNTELKQKRKEYMVDGRKAQQYLDACFEQMEKAKRRWEREMREAERAVANYHRLNKDDNSSKSDIEKARNNSSARQKMAEDSRRDYISNVRKFNEEQDHHYRNAMPHVFQRLQAMDEQRSTVLKKAFVRVADVQRQLLPLLEKEIDKSFVAAEAVNERQDANVVIDVFHTGQRIPKDIAIEDAARPARSSPEGDSGGYRERGRGTRDSGTGRIAEGKSKSMEDLGNSVGRAKGRRLPSKIDKVSIESVMDLPPHKRRQFLQQQIDNASRDLQHLTDERDGLMRLRDAYSATLGVGDPHTVDPQLQIVQQKIIKLQHWMRKQEGYLSECGDESSIRGSGRRVSGSDLGEDYRGEQRHGAVTSLSDKLVPGGHGAVTSLSDKLVPGSASNDLGKEMSPASHYDDQFDDEFDDDIEEAPTTGTALGNGQQCRALYPFNGEASDSLSMKEDECFMVLNADSGDGWTCVSRGEEQGYVPTSYLEPLPQQPDAETAVTYI
uniref:formin-binding protein 1-like isoform X2 n=1 Tax=Myxine glutinosa TaxID=7769 RepID=UPI00358DFEB5